MKLDFAGVPTSFQRSMMTKNLMNDSQYMGCTFAVISRRIATRASMTIDIVSVLTLYKSSINCDIIYNDFEMLIVNH